MLLTDPEIFDPPIPLPLPLRLIRTPLAGVQNYPMRFVVSRSLQKGLAVPSPIARTRINPNSLN